MSGPFVMGGDVDDLPPGAIQALHNEPAEVVFAEQSSITSEEIIALAGNSLVHYCHQAARNAGWWTDLRTGAPLDPIADKNLVLAKLALVHSEVSEAVEGHRKDREDDHLPQRLSIEVELADAVIRIADLCGALGLDLGGAIAEKMAYNAVRVDHSLAHRAAAGGKAV